MKIFISWSKDKSKEIAKVMKEFLCELFGFKIKICFSPDMPIGTEYNEKIHKELFESEKIIICLTKESFKSPHIAYEAGVIYGKNKKPKKDIPIVYPILFEPDDKWHSWVDKPLHRYKPADFCKNSIRKFINEIAAKLRFCVSDSKFDSKWTAFEIKIKEILEKEALFYKDCLELYNIFKCEQMFCFESPKIDHEKISFFRGYDKPLFYQAIFEILKKEPDKFWIYGRKNTNILINDSYGFIDYIKKNPQLDFRCLFVMPQSKAADKAEKDRESFYGKLYTMLRTAINLKDQGFDPSKIFRLYSEPRKNAMIICGNSIVFTDASPRGDGVPKMFNDSEFDLVSINSPKGKLLSQEFTNAWDNSKPLTDEIIYRLISSDDIGITSDSTLVVLISGVPGVGKTTISYELLKRNSLFRIIEETDIIRDALMGFSEYIQQKLPVLADNVLRDVNITPHTKLLTFEEAKEQCQIYKKSLEKIIERQQRKRIPTIINGVHIIPEMLHELTEKQNIIFINLYINNKETLRTRLKIRKSSLDMVNGTDLLFETNNDLKSSTEVLTQTNNSIYNIDVTELNVEDTIFEINKILRQLHR